MWDKEKFSNSIGGKKENVGYVEEGNVKKYLFSSTPTRVRFLTEDITPEDLIAEFKITREEAEDKLFTKVANERWIMPYSYWEHQIKEIPNKRYFATAACAGRGHCPLCVENDKDRANGINENKLLSYPVRKRFMVPAWFYDLKLVLFIIGNEEFFNDIATYVNKHGSASDFTIWKIGTGLNTKYKSAYDGVAELKDISTLDIITPAGVNISVDEVELKRRIEGGKPKQGSSVSAPATSSAPIPAVGGAGLFEITFGSHKGKTLQQLYDLGDQEYIEFLVKNSAGIVQEAAKTFLELVR